MKKQKKKCKEEEYEDTIPTKESSDLILNRILSCVEQQFDSLERLFKFFE
jgi:hypothetical protein